MNDGGQMNICLTGCALSGLHSQPLISDLSRRQFLTGLGALGAGTLLSKSQLLAQGPGGNVRRIDVHHHFGSPEFVAMTKAKQTQGWQTWQPYTPARAVESMDMGETQTDLPPRI
jgi:hypothetical protein